MEQVFDLMPVWAFAAAGLVALFAGFVKGAVGFAMPLLMLSGLSVFLEPALAIAGLIMPTMLSNVIQAFRFGPQAVWRTIVEYRRYILIVCMTIVGVAQFVTRVAPDAYYLILGIIFSSLAMVQLLGWQLVIPPGRERIGEIGVGLAAGAIGGFSGSWGPPTVLYLLALNTPRAKSMLVQGVIYALGSFSLVAGHVTSGVITWPSIVFSTFLLAPALIGQRIGWRMGDRLEPDSFRRIVLFVILLAGANLIRRGIF